MSQLEEIKARLAAISPGKWEAGRGATSDGSELVTTYEQKAGFLALSLNDEDSHLWLVDNCEVIPAVTGDGPRAQANAEFIAHAPETQAKLIAALEAALAIADELIEKNQDSTSLQGWGFMVAGRNVREAITEALA